MREGGGTGDKMRILNEMRKEGQSVEDRETVLVWFDDVRR